VHWLCAHAQGFFCYDTYEHVPYDKKHSDYDQVCLVIIVDDEPEYSYPETPTYTYDKKVSVLSSQHRNSCAGCTSLILETQSCSSVALPARECITGGWKFLWGRWMWLKHRNAAGKADVLKIIITISTFR